MAVAAGLALALLAGERGVAAEPGVIRDPDSPAGKEYALPLDAARRLGEGSEAAGREGVAKPFGIGITPRGSRRGGGGSDEQERGSGRPGEESGGGGVAEVAGGALDDAGGTTGTTLSIVLAVLFPGLLLGLLLRRQRGGRMRRPRGD